MLNRLLLGALALLALTVPAFAHLDPNEHGSFLAGLSHPLFGLDHILAMVAVGLWAALIGGRAIWAVPLAFVLTMIAGFGLALIGAPLPFVEPAILASVVVLGLVVALAMPVPVWAGVTLAGFFAVFHGHAHGGELGSAELASFGAGFAISTAVLHAAGVGLGLGVGGLFANRAKRAMTRSLGALTALAGVWLALGN
ncbi:MAG: HupE/UreJ family protein [Cucumibacter sp.]